MGQTNEAGENGFSLGGADAPPQEDRRQDTKDLDDVQPHPEGDVENCPVVGIGASAGGLEAFGEFLKAVPTDTGMAFVLVQHLDPHHTSSLAQLLGQRTELPVVEVSDGTMIRPNHVYVIPPNTKMTIAGGVLRLTPRAEGLGRYMPIDTFLCSLAEDRKANAVGVILSGAATDGTLGLKAIKSEGGITFAQDESAKFDGDGLQPFPLSVQPQIIRVIAVVPRRRIQQRDLLFLEQVNEGGEVSVPAEDGILWFSSRHRLVSRRHVNRVEIIRDLRDTYHISVSACSEARKTRGHGTNTHKRNY